MRIQVVKALQIIEDILSSDEIPIKYKKALFQVRKTLLELQDSMVLAKSRTRDIAYTLSELAKILGLEIKIGSPRFSLTNEEVAEILNKSIIADLDVEGEKTIVKKVVAHT